MSVVQPSTTQADASLKVISQISQVLGNDVGRLSHDHVDKFFLALVHFLRHHADEVREQAAAKLAWISRRSPACPRRCQEIHAGLLRDMLVEGDAHLSPSALANLHAVVAIADGADPENVENPDAPVVASREMVVQVASFPPDAVEAGSEQQALLNLQRDLVSRVQGVVSATALKRDHDSFVVMQVKATALAEGSSAFAQVLTVFLEARDFKGHLISDGDGSTAADGEEDDDWEYWGGESKDQQSAGMGFTTRSIAGPGSMMSSPDKPTGLSGMGKPGFNLFNTANMYGNAIHGRVVEYDDDPTVASRLKRIKEREEEKARLADQSKSRLSKIRDGLLGKLW